VSSTCYMETALRPWLLLSFQVIQNDPNLASLE